MAAMAGCCAMLDLGESAVIEPLDDAHRKIEAGSREFKPLGAVAPQMALGDSEGTVEINIAGNSTSSSILPMLQTTYAFGAASAIRGQAVSRGASARHCLHPIIDQGAFHPSQD